MPLSIIAIGLATFLPAYFGALPWVASKSAISSPVLAPGREAQAADEAGAEVAEDVTEQVGHHHDVVELGLLHQLHGHVVDDAIVELDLRELLGDILAPRAATALPCTS